MKTATHTAKDGSTTKVEIVNKSGGWTTIMTPDGVTKKVRNSTLSGAKSKASSKKKAAKEKVSKKTTKKATTKKGDDKRLIDPDMTRYTTSDVATASGRKSVDIDDKVAKKLRGKSLDEAYKVVATELSKVDGKVTAKELKVKYGHLNPGMQRMNLGNKLRAIL